MTKDTLTLAKTLERKIDMLDVTFDSLAYLNSSTSLAISPAGGSAYVRIESPELIRKISALIYTYTTEEKASLEKQLNDL
jgi:hypothetical protein